MFISIKIAIVMPLLLLAACTKPVSQFPLSITSATELNLDDKGRPLSAVLRIQQLRDDGPFRKMTQEASLSASREKEILGNSLINEKEILLTPGENMEELLQLKEGVRFIAVTGQFRKADPHWWRLLYDITKINKKGIVLQAGACHLSPQSPPSLPLAGQHGAPHPDCHKNATHNSKRR